MEQYNLSFCKFIKHSESLLEVIMDKRIDIGIEHAKEVNDVIKSLFTVPYGVLVELRNDLTFTFEGGVKIGNSKLERKVALLINQKRTEITASCLIHMQNAGFPKKELKIFYDRDSAIKWLSKL